MTKTQETKPATKVDTSNWKSVRYPYWELKEGATVCGEVIAIHKGIKGKFGSRNVIDVRLLEATSVRDGKDKAKKPIIKTLEAGNVARFEVRAGMGQLDAYLSVGDLVYVKATGKVETDKGNDAWTFDVKYQPAAPESDDQGEDD